jgi:hypothetical protein
VLQRITPAAGQSHQAGTVFTSERVEAEGFTNLEPDTEFNTNAARDRTCFSPEDGDIWSLSSQQEPAVAHKSGLLLQILPAAIFYQSNSFDFILGTNQSSVFLIYLNFQYSNKLIVSYLDIPISNIYH